nr:hypothetical protein [Tanacetum cinerariifolium]
MLVDKDYPLRKGLALVMISYKFQVENYSQMSNDAILKIYKIANSPRQQGFNEFSSNIATAVVCLATNRVYNFLKMIFDGMVRNVNNKVSKILMYPRFLSKCLKMSQFGQIAHTDMYVVPFHTRKVFTTLRVNSRSFLGRTVPLFDSMLVHQGEGLGTPTEPHHTPFPEAQQSPHTALSSPSLPPATTEIIPTSTSTEIPILRQYSRRARIAQSSALPTATDEPASLLGYDSQGEACPTISGLEAGQDRANIIKTSALPHDSTPRVTSLAADEGSMKQQLNELTDLYATIKGRSLETREEAGVERSTEKGSNDSEELVNILTSFDATNILTSEVQVVSVPPAAEVSTVCICGMVPTASPIFTIASVVTPYSRCRGKEKMVESYTPKKKKLQEKIDVQVAREMEEQMARKDQRRSDQIERDAEIARIHAEEELQMLIDGFDRNNEVIARHLHEYEQAADELTIGEKIKLNNKLIEDFVPMASKEEGERFKRKGLMLEQESPKKIKTSEEVSQEDLKEMMQLVPVEEVYVEGLQVKHQIIDSEIHFEGQRNYWKIIRQATINKDKELWVELKRLFEPDVKDQLWTHTQALMHDPLEWRLYDSCGVHHVLTRDQEIFMLVEKDYSLRKGLAIVMLSNKL